MSFTSYVCASIHPMQLPLHISIYERHNGGYNSLLGYIELSHLWEEKQKQTWKHFQFPSLLIRSYVRINGNQKKLAKGNLLKKGTETELLRLEITTPYFVSIIIFSILHKMTKKNPEWKSNIHDNILLCNFYWGFSFKFWLTLLLSISLITVFLLLH